MRYQYRRDSWDVQDFQWITKERFLELAEEAYRDHPNKENILADHRADRTGGFQWNGISVWVLFDTDYSR